MTSSKTLFNFTSCATFCYDPRELISVWPCLDCPHLPVCFSWGYEYRPFILSNMAWAWDNNSVWSSAYWNSVWSLTRRVLGREFFFLFTFCVFPFLFPPTHAITILFSRFVPIHFTYPFFFVHFITTSFFSLDPWKHYTEKWNEQSPVIKWE